MDKQLLRKYKNGNYTVFLYTDGTKEKVTEADFFKADFPDSVDLKITDYCDANCPMCHENSSAFGLHASFDAPFLNSLPNGIELAIGGGNPLSHPELIPFLEKMKAMGIVCNITVNEKHLIANNTLIAQLVKKKLVWGVGVSVTNASEKAVEFLKGYTNSVAHLICGIVSPQILKKLKNTKVLFLGYKQKGRGKTFYNEEIESNLKRLKNTLPYLFNHFESISFDNLALEQTKIFNFLSKKEYKKRFMGKDGEGSMYIDLVNKKYALSSTSTQTFDLQDNIRDMFKHVNSLTHTN